MIELLKFLGEHADLIELVIDAIRGGVSKEEIKANLKRQMTEASDALMRKELG